MLSRVAFWEVIRALQSNINIYYYPQPAAPHLLPKLCLAAGRDSTWERTAPNNTVCMIPQSVQYHKLPPPHCKGNSVYIFLFWELRGLSPNFHIHVSVSDLYIPRIGPHISSSRKGRPIVGLYNSLTDTWMWKLGLRPRYSFSGNTCFKFFGILSLQCKGLTCLLPARPGYMACSVECLSMKRFWSRLTP
jgi:hypothetical protein